MFNSVDSGIHRGGGQAGSSRAFSIIFSHVFEGGVHTAQNALLSAFFCYDARCAFQPPDWLSAPRPFVDPVRRQCVSWAFACWEYSALMEAMQCAGTRGSSARRSALGE